MDQYTNLTSSSTKLHDLPGFKGNPISGKMFRDGSLRREFVEHDSHRREGGNMNIESNRVASFKGDQNFPVSIYRLANAGLYFTGNGDEVECFSCYGKMKNWKKDDSPKRRHKRMFPNCRFVNGLDMRNISDVQYVPNEKSNPRILRPTNHAKANQPGYLRDQRKVMLEDSQQKLTVNNDFRSEKTRLTSFKLWPFSSPVDPYELSASGFYMVNEFTVQCFACFGRITSSSFQVGDRPMKKHRLMFPSCPFVKGLKTGNQPMTKDERKSVLRHEIHESSANTQVQKMRSKFPQYDSRESRLLTFKNWTVSYVIKPTALAEAGFFYTNKSDQVTCFCCGLRLEAWNPEDDAWSEHASWSPNCAWVLEKKGRYFVKSVLQ